MTDRVGQQLGNYQLLRLLGEGGFAEVYLGEHIHLGTQAAIKVLHTQLTSDDVDKFRTEARTIARLIHPHIVRVLEFGVEGKTPFLVMDYAPNGTLRQKHPKGIALPLPLIVAYVKQVADALQYAHDEKLIHRDIKPENILLGRRNDILLSDFGIALVAQSSRYQSAQEMAGTMAYMAPEQIQGKPRPASDQYALAIVVYEWLSGDRPFHGSLTELVGQHLSVLPPSLQEKVSMISSEVDQVVLTALAKDPKQRFPSVQAFASALEEADQLVHPTSFVVASPLIQLSQSEVIAPSLGQPSLPPDTLATILPSPSPLPINRVTPPSQSLQPTSVIAQPNQSQLPIDTVIPTPIVLHSTEEDVISNESHSIQQPQHRISRRTVIISLAGLAVVGGSSAWLALSQKPQVSSPTPYPTPTSVPTDTPTPTPIPIGTTLLTYHGHSAEVTALAWSPDGRRIVSGSYRKAQIWDTTTGNTIFTYQAQTYGVNAVAWSPDGKRIASGSGDTTVQVWNATTGNTIFTYRGHSDIVNAVAWSPDGKRIASASGSDTTNRDTVQVWNATTGNTIFTYHGHSNLVLSVAWSPDGKRIASASHDKTVQVWDATDGGHVLIYRGHSDDLTTVSWSPDGKRIASGGFDSRVQVWDATDGGHVLIYRGHLWPVNAVPWSPDGKRIASGDNNSIVQMWDATTGNTIFTYHGHSNLVSTVAWSPDGTRIASGSFDKTVQVWKAI